MMDGMGWQQLAAAVDGGELTMELGTARQCAQRCQVLLDQLDELRNRARALGTVEGFGILPSGVTLAEKFSKKAIGGDYSMVQALTDHIEQVELMRTVFETIERRYAETDQANVSMIGAIDRE